MVGSELKGDAEGGLEASTDIPGQAASIHQREIRHTKEWRKPGIRDRGRANAELHWSCVQACSPEASMLHFLLPLAFPGFTVPTHPHFP